MLHNENMNNIFSLYNVDSHKHLMEIPAKRLPIAYIELIAVLVGFSVFADANQNHLITIYSDNTDVVSWLQKGRCSAGIGFKLLAAIEFYKRKFHLKISARHIRGIHNNTADSLSRGTIPSWLSRCGCRRMVNVDVLYNLINAPEIFWTSLKL